MSCTTARLCFLTIYPNLEKNYPYRSTVESVSDPISFGKVEEGNLGHSQEQLKQSLWFLVAQMPTARLKASQKPTPKSFGSPLEIQVSELL